MSCPICTGSDLPYDVSVVEKQGMRVILQGTIRYIFYRESPFADYFTVSLYPRKGRVKYLKFQTRDEMEKLGFTEEKIGKRVRCEGCLHWVDGKEVVFDVTNVKFLE